ncbi:hypothetical protein EKO27_g7832 [Xylaria grammica]|uniref:O-methyltransferase C-terminal domain-containing protein n=1 Tax=Xylaria grammica TaxID=363999 RepID=A0A439CYI6_9PEZI|nr:hypothetical protein EKO27_g7832 [Xylaria grammica]
MADLTKQPSGRIMQLAHVILENISKIDTYLKENGLPDLSLHPNAPPMVKLPQEAELNLQQALTAMDELNVLLLGPLGWLKLQVGHAYNLVSLHAMYHYDITDRFAVGQEKSLQDIAVACGVNEDSMSRILQHAVANHLLAQPRPGYVSHNACSALLSQSPALKDWVGSVCEDLWPAASRVIPALNKWPDLPALPTHTAFNLAENTTEPFFHALAGDKPRTRRFASAMGLMQNMPGFEASAALDAYNWAALGSATVVDVGGSQGVFACALKRKYPDLRVIVQDLPEVVAAAKSHFEAGDAIGVSLQSHNFFQPQPLRDVDVYFFRLILHDWPDEYCSRILQALTPALKPGARIILNDFTVPTAGSLPLFQERQIR